MKKTPASAVHLALTLALGLAAATGAQAQDFPGGKPITIVVPFAAGGPTDRVARDLAEAMRKPLDGTSIVIDNAAGAGSTIGNAKVARARPDGYTLLLTHVGMATTPVLYRKLPYNYETDFEYLGMINDVPMTVIGKPQLQARSFGELREWIAKNPGKTNLGNAGIGSASHLCGLLLQSELKAEMTTVPYKGTAPAIADLLGGQIDLLCDQTTNTTSQIEAGKVKAYGVTTLKRLGTPALKDLPTLDESGLKNFQVTIWHGLYAPKGTPAPVLRKLNDALKAALKDPEFVKKEEGLGAVVVADRRVEPAEHRKFVQQEVARFGPVVKAAGVYAD
ncbi:tripartite tricarboxylate transporter substrate-binding protein [Variovorax atrisoli]|jgi:tripartite-type tricarboxylate transporter receptor subunit TctC|uniref:tripartite tricarboxylate transporter substrate-binding protein n=1 Tax=Variovorax TaxID=34072 RepID=UPI000F7E7315|nr:MULTISPECIES: tripartite tricarboxylate transporter substrate-binding protein [Variovorax]MBB3638965.1 tripartite-type tricarboxylate transporter receptor subunit TctC [Variovorax sp. BK613]MDR6519194.1 tripartite-type tricarboxylate transporter receptor subunit TctC [Variovorax paradoxus]RTD95938.1 tripartite tricarboxylate transporter substrate binding protein BugD [Variovorax sp. 369]